MFTNAASLTVGDSVFVNNSAASGGVLALDGQSTVRVFSSNMTDNSGATVMYCSDVRSHRILLL